MDIDECEFGGLCGTDNTCVNLVGSFECHALNNGSSFITTTGQTSQGGLHFFQDFYLKKMCLTKQIYILFQPKSILKMRAFSIARC